MRITLPEFVGYLVTNGSPRITRVLNARRAKEGPTPYKKNDYYLHLRQPLREAFLAGGDPQPLLEALDGVHDGKKVENYREIVAGLSKFFASTIFEARQVRKRCWVHGPLEVTVNPLVRIKIDDEWFVIFVHLKADDLNARSVAPALQLIELTHGQFGTPLLLDARRGKAHLPSRSLRTRRGLRALLEAEAEAFVSLWNNVIDEVA